MVVLIFISFQQQAYVSENNLPALVMLLLLYGSVLVDTLDFIKSDQVWAKSVPKVMCLFLLIERSYLFLQVVHHPSDVSSILCVHCPQHSLCGADLHKPLHRNQWQHRHLRPGAVHWWGTNCVAVVVGYMIIKRQNPGLKSTSNILHLNLISVRPNFLKIKKIFFIYLSSASEWGKQDPEEGVSYLPSLLPGARTHWHGQEPGHGRCLPETWYKNNLKIVFF